jgi:hypothetical protein
MVTWKGFLQKTYFNIANAGSFAGPRKVQLILKENGYDVAIGQIRQWLNNVDAYSLFKPVRYRFKRDRVVTSGIDDLWDVDLADVSNISDENEKNKYLLIAVDVFSRFLWIEPIKTKTKQSVKNAFVEMFKKTTRRPEKIRSDKGREFNNELVRDYLKLEGIKHFSTKNETKANYAERVIRTVKTMMYRYFMHRQTHRYVDILQKLVQNYNDRPHRSLFGLKPTNVNKRNEMQIWKRMYVDSSSKVTPRRRYKFKIGDKVRISYLKYNFQRDYQQKWTEEFFVVYQRSRRPRVNLYYLKDMKDEQIDGLFYEQELQKIEKDTNEAVYRIEKVLKQRKRRGKVEYFVKWMGWPAKFNTWIDERTITRF